MSEDVDDVDDVGGSGYSLEDLSAYLDRGRTPRIPAIERNAECQALLASMERMGRLSREIVDEQATEPLAESWYDEIMREVMREFRAGRDIPLTRTADGTQLVVTEGALYELIRTVGDDVAGVLVGRVRIDQPEPTDALDVRVTVSVLFGYPMQRTVDLMCDGIRAAIERHGELRVGRVDVTVGDVHVDVEDE